MTINDAIAKFNDYIATEKRMASGTVNNYIADLRDLEGYISRLGVETLDDLTANDVRAWQMEHMERGEAAGTVRRRLSSVSSWLLYLRKHGFFDKDIMVKLSAPHQPRRLPVFFRESELEHLYDDGIFTDDFDGQRDKLMLRMLYETGIRRSELVGLKEQSADMSTLTLKVLGKRNKERIIPIEPELAYNISNYIALKRQKVGETEWLFVTDKGRQVTVGLVYRKVKQYMSSLSNADRISPHVFRHSFATHMLNEGGNIEAIRELLGHEDLATTEIYTHVTREHLKEVYKNAFPRGKGK